MYSKFLLILVVIYCSCDTVNMRRRRSYRMKNPFEKPIFPMRPIVGGHSTNIEDIGGYLVALRDNYGFFCGGSYVQDRIIVTAAHCLSQRMHNLHEVTAEGDVTFIEQKKRNTVPVSKAIMHPHYNSATNDNDVAVIKLKKSLIGDNIKTIDLCTRNYEVDDTATVSGWGFKTERGLKPVNQVRTVDVPVFSRTTCDKIYYDVNRITKSMLCAGELGKKDACTFDSGGPLVIEGELCGIVSFGVGCASPIYPGVYANVKHLKPFIKTSIQKLSEEKKKRRRKTK